VLLYLIVIFRYVVWCLGVCVDFVAASLFLFVVITVDFVCLGLGFFVFGVFGCRYWCCVFWFGIIIVLGIYCYLVFGLPGILMFVCVFLVFKFSV